MGRLNLRNKNNQDLFNFLDNFKKRHIVYVERFPLFIENVPYSDERGMEPPYKKGKRIQHNQNQIETNKQLVNESISNLLQHSEKFYLIYPIPEQPYNPIQKYSKTRKIISSPFNKYKSRVKNSYDALNKVESNKVIRIYPEKVFCDILTNKCYENDTNGLFYSSSNHLTDYGAEKLLYDYFPLERFIDAKN